MQLPTNLTRRQAMIAVIAAVIVIGGLGLFVLNIRKKNNTATAAKLTIWGTDSAQAFNDLISSYTGPGSNANTNIVYTQISPSNYRNEVLSAIAAGDGPDILEIGNRHLAEWQNVLAPVPVAYKKDFNLVTLQNYFPYIVGQDFVNNGNIYALPLSVDTLAMFYNKNLLDTAGVATVPKTWTQFDSDIPKLRITNSVGQITQAAAAIGGSTASIPNAPDLVFLLMMQNGTQMISSNGSSVAFADASNSSGLNAFNFYLQFAQASSPYYTWNDSMGNALDSFAQGKTAIMFGYASDIAALEAKSPFLNYGIAPMPQPANASVAVNYANYDGLAVNKNSPNVAAAWSFIINLTTSPTDENIYTKDTGLPPALRSVIASDMSNPSLAVFASQALTARSWPEANPSLVNSAIDTAIKDVLSGSANSTNALSQAQAKINGN